MKECRDLSELEKLSLRMEDENWRFRDFLKKCTVSEAEIDRIVQELYRQESEQFDCKTCAGCCKGISPMLGDEDVARLSEGIGIPADRLISEYLVIDEEYGTLKFNQSPCPLLKGDMCSCYLSRPRDCAAYPHLHKDGFLHRLTNMVGNCSVCPIVFNVFERLKTEMRPYGWNRHTSGRGRG